MSMVRLEFDTDSRSKSLSSPLNPVPRLYVVLHITQLVCSGVCCYRSAVIIAFGQQTDIVVIALLLSGQLFWLFAMVQLFSKIRRGPLLFWLSDIVATTFVWLILLTIHGGQW